MDDTDKLKEFARWVIEQMREMHAPEPWAIRDKAEGLGLIVKIVDTKNHKTLWADWYELSEILKS